MDISISRSNNRYYNHGNYSTRGSGNLGNRVIQQETPSIARELGGAAVNLAAQAPEVVKVIGSFTVRTIAKAPEVAGAIGSFTVRTIAKAPEVAGAIGDFAVGAATTAVQVLLNNRVFTGAAIIAAVALHFVPLSVLTVFGLAAAAVAIGYKKLQE